MIIKDEYEKLYQHWLKEFRQTDLTPLTKELFNNYKKNLDFINDIKQNKKEKIKFELINTYKKNFNFILNDFLRIRELKIINFALALQEIELNDLLEAERLFYQNLISSVKGFKKVKVISTYEEIEDDQIKKIMEEKAIRNIVSNKVEELYQEKDTVDYEINFKAKGEKFNYTLVKFLKKTPPLVGVDLLNYGPFEREDIANMPSKNANILISEKYAEKIQLD